MTEQAEPDPVADLTVELKQFLPVFAPRGEPFVTELRVLGVPGWKADVKPLSESGFFDLQNQEGRAALLRTVSKYVTRPAEAQPSGVYVIINPVDQVYLSAAKNCMGRKGEKISAEDKLVLARRWLVVDVDPIRPIAKVSATDDEKAAARSVLDGVREDMRASGWAEPMVCDSGNGFHLWYRVDLPTDDGGFVEHTLKELAKRHNTARATVDTSVFNPSRIMKVPGTWARKGSSTDERPHRMCRVLEVPTDEGQHVQSDAA